VRAAWDRNNARLGRISDQEVQRRSAPLAGVDLISLGWITHGALILDLGSISPSGR
jgi:hypothetical protein